MKLKYLLTSLIVILTLWCSSNAYSQTSKNVVVLVKYKAQPGKEALALTNLKKLVDHVKAEPNYVDIKVYVDPADKTNILLHEQWLNEDYYKGDHMNTSHLKQFISDSRSFLAGPPEITFWNMAD